MGDAPTRTRSRPDRRALFEIASGQRGYFTAKQATRYGYSHDLLAHHARTGTFRRVARGLYRFRDYPSTPREEVVASWLAAGPETAVVSHDSALELWELGDNIPQDIHLTVPRERRHLPRLPGVRFHTTSRPLGRDDVRPHEGALITTPARTLLDLAEAGTLDDYLGYALYQAIRRGWVTQDELKDAARQRGPRAQRGVERALRADFGQFQDDEQAGYR